jgi:septum formation protein
VTAVEAAWAAQGDEPRVLPQRDFDFFDVMTDFLYLASQSPRRSQLLDQLGIRHVPLVANASGDVQEDAEAIEEEREGEVPENYVVRVTRAKLDAAVARRVRRGLALAPVLCADTTVALGGRILGKPRSAKDAGEMLAALSGTAHQVWTAVAVQGVDGRHESALSRSEVRFAPWSDAEIARYIDTGEPFGKAGGYGIQGRAAGWVEHISGSYSGIMGLPLFETARLLKLVGLPIGA